MSQTWTHQRLWAWLSVGALRHVSLLSLSFPRWTNENQLKELKEQHEEKHHFTSPFSSSYHPTDTVFPNTTLETCYGENHKTHEYSFWQYLCNSTFHGTFAMQCAGFPLLLSTAYPTAFSTHWISGCWPLCKHWELTSLTCHFFVFLPSQKCKR